MRCSDPSCSVFLEVRRAFFTPCESCWIRTRDTQQPGLPSKEENRWLNMRNSSTDLSKLTVLPTNNPEHEQAVSLSRSRIGAELLGAGAENSY